MSNAIRMLVVVLAVGLLVPSLALADVIEDEDTGQTREPRPEPAPPPPAAPAPAPPPPQAVAPTKDWRARLAVWGALLEADGNNIVEGVPVDLTADLGDVWGDGASWEVGGRGEYWWKNFGTFVETRYWDVDSGKVAQVFGFDIDYDLQKINVDFGLSYAAFRKTLSNDRIFSIEPLIGGRFAWFEQRGSAGLGPAFRVSQRESYWEPFLGLRSRYEFHPRWSFTLGGDIGGFGAGSDLTWNALGEIGFAVTEMLELTLGAAAEGVDYDTGSGADKFQVDYTSWGPRFGLALHF